MLVLAVARPPQRWTSLAAAEGRFGSGSGDVARRDTRYDDSWSPVIGLVIALWLVLLGICSQARRVTD